jgi:hypothetical protein
MDKCWQTCLLIAISYSNIEEVRTLFYIVCPVAIDSVQAWKLNASKGHGPKAVATSFALPNRFGDIINGHLAPKWNVDDDDSQLMQAVVSSKFVSENGQPHA